MALFIDLVGSMALSERLDPEDLREVMRRYQFAMAGAVTPYVMSAVSRCISATGCRLISAGLEARKEVRAQ